MLACIILFILQQQFAAKVKGDDGLGNGELTRAVSRLEGSITTFTTTMTTRLDTIQLAIQDGTRRMDKIEARLDAVVDVIASHSRSIEAGKGKPPG